ncbi:Regulation of nuclear pre-mRNA domain-containing protein 2 [Larimichthys crocea]|uniref:Regulation of nuclear pre-mRNA domain-containing protein 2 n=1 Tax=Larimichthys crocea TaxID=215358 RepID=A0A6G0HRW1_LARCR|nr:Regulation of nuclear pre-mRNA domain-containing protein 2 [Larimichthys crocea]
MAAGAGAASGGSLESTLDKKFRSVTNTMDSIQGLSTWCIDNKKYHSLIVRHWMKSMKKSDASHRLNLFYLANDVIQNCKRKNAIVYRTAFAEVLRDAFLLVNFEGDPKVTKSVERILSIWEDRGVYSGTLITELRSSLVKEESPPETPVEQKTPVESKAEIRSKVVAEFVPQALLDELSKYKRSVEEIDLREKQLTAMRVDICSSEALKKLKDKAGGKKFSKDFEEGSAQLQEFVKFLDKQCKTGPPLMEALTNADIFYETQYNEVKIVANAYQTFANRVSHLKRKLDTLKATLPDLDDSPIPSPSADAPSPTGSESPFHGLEMAHPDPDLDGSAMDDEAEPPAPSPLSSPGGSPRNIDALGENDNREVEDMELSDEEMDSGGIIVEQRVERSTQPEVSTPACAKTEPSVVTVQPVAQVTPTVAAPAAAVESVDLGKIGSILNSLSSVMKSTGPSVESPPAAAPAGSSLRTTPAASLASQDATSLVNILSKVDVSPADLLGALSKVHGQSSRDGINSLLSSPAANVSSDSSTTGKIPPSSSSTSASAVSSQSLPVSSVAPVPSSFTPTVGQSTDSKTLTQTSNPASALVQALHRDMDLTTETEPSSSSKSLESKIHSFLQGNSAFSSFDLGFMHSAQRSDNLSPVTGADNQDGTPVRDEGGGTPTQDEIMDKPVVAPLPSNTNQPSIGETFNPAPVAYQNSSQQNPSNPQQQAHLQPGVAQNGQVYQPYPYGNHEMSEHGITAPVAHFQQISAQTGGPVPGERAPGSASSTQTVEGFQGVSERRWYGDIYPEGNSQQPRGYNATPPEGAGDNAASGLYPYRVDQTQQPQELASQQGAAMSSGFFRSTLPPVPNFPPPLHAPPATSGVMIPREPHADTGEGIGARADSVISGMVVHDHQHKSMFNPDEPMYDHDRPRPPHPPHPDVLRPHPDNLQYQEDPERYHNEVHHRDDMYFQEDPYRHPEDPYYRPGSPPHHYPRPRGRLTPPFSPSEDPYFTHDYQRHSPPPPQHYTPRRPPPHLEIRHPGLRPPPHRPPHRPPHPAHHPHPRGPLRPPPPFPRFHGPDPRMRGKRPGPRGGGNAGPMFAPKRPFLPPRY